MGFKAWELGFRVFGNYLRKPTISWICSGFMGLWGIKKVFSNLLLLEWRNWSLVGLGFNVKGLGLKGSEYTA